jgi:hypothetical protein
MQLLKHVSKKKDQLSQFRDDVFGEYNTQKELVINKSQQTYDAGKSEIREFADRVEDESVNLFLIDGHPRILYIIYP